MALRPSELPLNPGDFTKIIATEKDYDQRVELWRLAIMDLEQEDLFRVMRDVKSETTTLSSDSDAFYKALERCRDLLTVQRFSDLISRLLVGGMTYPAGKITEMLKRKRVNAALSDIPVKAIEETRAEVDELLSDVPNPNDEKDLAYTRKQVAVLLRRGTPIGRRIAALPLPALKKLDYVGNEFGHNLSELGNLPVSAWTVIEQYVSPSSTMPKADFKATLQKEFKSLSA